MRLTGVTWRGYILPFRDRFVISDSRATSRFGLLIFLQTGDGLVGVGEASPVGTGSLDDVRKIADVLERIVPRLLERDTDSMGETISAWEMSAPLRFGLETALLDLQGQARGLPLAVLLGGKPSAIAVNALIATESLEEAVAEARKVVELGFTSLKLKVGRRELDDDEALVSSVRQAIGPEVRLRLDPNQAWDRDQAIESIQRLSRYKIEYVEQPVPAVDIASLAEVGRAVPVPVAADESLGSLEDLHRLLSANAADIFILKAARLGGLKAALDVAKVVIETRRSVVVTTSLESDIGIAASAHLAAAVSADALAQGLATGLLFKENLVSPRLLPANGMLATPNGPGLGVKVDAVLLRKYGVDVMGSAGSSSGLREYLSARRS